jgi:hypothetical protein
VDQHVTPLAIVDHALRRRRVPRNHDRAVGCFESKSERPASREHIFPYTTFLVDGTLFCYLTIVPEKDAAAFLEPFKRIGQSIRLTDAR